MLVAKELEQVRTKEVKMQAEINILRNEHSELILSYHKIDKVCNSLKEENKALRDMLARVDSQPASTPRTSRPPRYLLSGSNPPMSHRTINPPFTASVGEGETFRHGNVESAPPPVERVNMSG